MYPPAAGGEKPPCCLYWLLKLHLIGELFFNFTALKWIIVELFGHDWLMSWEKSLQQKVIESEENLIKWLVSSFKTLKIIVSGELILILHPELLDAYQYKLQSIPFKHKHKIIVKPIPKLIVGNEN